MTRSADRTKSPARSTARTPRWSFEPVDVGRSGAAGDLSKLFKNERSRIPEVFLEGAPEPEATVMAREVIQNSWDAAVELRDHHPDAAFKIEFRFRTLAGAQRDQLVSELALDELADRIASVDNPGDGGSPRHQLGLDADDALSRIRSRNPLNVLEIIEHATTGMYGPFNGTSSKLYMGLVSVGFTAKQSGAGGSFGFGKAGLIQGSATKTVVAYTCFQDRVDDPGVTRRLLGMTYWGRHSVDGEAFTGFARLGKRSAQGPVVPFENDEADGVAEALGLGTRSPTVTDQLGTSFLLIDPTVSPEDLKRAVERNWWPALNDHEFSVEIHRPDGTVLIPRPKLDPVLRTFVRAYELACVPQDSELEGEWAKGFNRFRRSDGTFAEVGRTGLVSDPQTWSYPARAASDDDIEHRSLIALVRGPKMVVEYLDAGRQMPFVRGTFVAHDDIDELLRQTEPKAHDSWQSHATDGTDPDAPLVVDRIVRGLRRQVADFRKKIRPVTIRRDHSRLPFMERLFVDLFGDAQPPQSGRSEREVRVEIREEVEGVVGTSHVALRGTCILGLTEAASREHLEVDVQFRYVLLEDGRPGAPCRLTVTPPAGFEEVDTGSNWFRGSASRDGVVFTFCSDPYDNNWSGKLSVLAEPSQTAAGAADGGR